MTRNDDAKRSSPGPAVAALVLACAIGGAAAGPKGTAWTQWGGPDGSFVAPSAGLAADWPEAGPRKLWSRELGGGYSAILAEGGRLYTMYRTQGREVVVSLDAASGETVWERGYEAAPHPTHVTQFGDGPRSTPLIVGDRLYTIGVSGRMHCLDKRSGEVVWSHDLWGEEFGGSVLNHGYSSSPIAYANLVYVLVGGEKGSIVALSQKDGRVVWRRHSFGNSYSTPRILEVDGRDELVTFMKGELVGLDPKTGELRWSYAHENQWGQNINMPVMADRNHLFLSSPEAGARGLKLTRKEDGTVAVEELWSTRKIQFYPRQLGAPGRLRLRLDRHDGAGLPRRRQHPHRRDRLARARVRQGQLRAGRRPADHPRRGRQPGAGDGHTRGAGRALAGPAPGRGRLDRADGRRPDAVRP